jgi:hypothetical protein
VDHAFERKPAGGGDDRGAGGQRSARGHDALGFFLQGRAGGAREDAGDAAAVGEVAVRRVDDRVDRLGKQVAADDLEAPSGA